MQQETQNLSCPNCLHPYDLSTYLPFNLPTCSHSLCNDCINILKEFGEIFKCPIDEINCNFKNFQLQDFTVNTPLKKQLEASQDPNICKLHKQELRIRCLTDGSRICHQCLREDLHSGHDTKRIEEIVSESQAKVELLENSIQELTGYSEKIEKKLEDVEKSLIDIVNSHCDRFGTKEERKKAIFAHVKSTTENEKKALEELLGAGSATKMKAVTKIVFLKSLTLENMKEDLKEEDLDISKYLKLITKEKFEKQYNEIEKQFEKRKNKYYVAIDLYKQDDYRIESMEAHSIVREKLNYLTGQPLQKRIKEVVVANKGWLKLVLFGLAFFLLAYIMIITGAAKPFGKDLSKYKIFKEIGKSWKHMKKATKKKEEKFPFMNKKGRGRRPRFRFL